MQMFKDSDVISLEKTEKAETFGTGKNHWILDLKV